MWEKALSVLECDAFTVRLAALSWHNHITGVTLFKYCPDSVDVVVPALHEHLQTVCSLFPRVKYNLSDLSLFECSIHFRGLVKPNNPVNQVASTTDASKDVLSLHCNNTSVYDRQDRTHRFSPNNSKAGGNIVRAGHLPNSRDTFLLYSCRPVNGT